MAIQDYMFEDSVVLEKQKDRYCYYGQYIINHVTYGSVTFLYMYDVF